MKIKYKILVDQKTPASIELTFKILFGFGFVFTTARRITDWKIINGNWTVNEREEWNWIINGYDEHCQKVIGVKSCYDGDNTMSTFTKITLDEFLWIMCEEIRQPALPIRGDTPPDEYFKFTPPV